MTIFECVPFSEEIDQVKLAIVKLLFDKDLNLESGVFCNELDGTKTIKIVFKPKDGGNND
ncbi:MAG: hypothetical protein IJI96_02625 [Methanobrevibacter sp.]|nr:hypothetical protein [Methanobrevibacter sp.]MBQ6627401.1 hypothetical protein [Methanobrevibacter sp.]